MKKVPVSRRRFLRRAVSRGLLATGLGLGGYGWRLEPHWVEVVHRKLGVANLPDRLQNARLVHISDLHVGPVVDESYMRASLRRVLALEPDMIAVTGDWMTCVDGEQIARTLSVVKELKPSNIPVVGILGNHDYGQYYRRHVADELSNELRKIDVHLLQNESTEFFGLQFAGTDDLWCHRCKVLDTLGSLDRSAASILMVHNPDIVDLKGIRNYQGWILAGHTHGGQFWLPGLGAPILPVNNKRYSSGEFDLGGGRRLYINRGLGYKHRVRFMVRPEITVFHLRRDLAHA